MEKEPHLFEELCKKGKTYRAKRMAAGEKSSAYLSGRAVKVCKGQMKSEGEEYSEIEQEWDNLSFDEKKEIIDVATSGEGRPDEVEKDFDQLKSELGFEFESAIADYVGIDEPEVYEEMKVTDKDGNDVTSDIIKKMEKSLEKDGYKITKGYTSDPDIRKGYKNSTKDEALTHPRQLKPAKEEMYEEIDALHENEEYCPKCATKIKKAIREEIEKVAKEAKTKPAKGKRFAKKVKNKKTGRTRTVSYGQAGKAKKGGDRIRPGTAKGNAYCARSAKIKKCKNPPCANTLSRKKWKCQGSRSVK